MIKKYLVYGTLACPFCVEAIELLRSRDIKFLFFDLANDLEFLAEAKSFYGSPTIPIILENDEHSGQVKLIGGSTDLAEYLCE